MHDVLALTFQKVGCSETVLTSVRNFPMSTLLCCLETSKHNFFFMFHFLYSNEGKGFQTTITSSIQILKTTRI